MPRLAATLGLVGCLLFAQGASASVTLDLIWADTDTPTLTVLPGDPAASVPVGQPCGDGFLSGAGAGRCLILRLASTIPLVSALSAMRWDGTELLPDFGHVRPGFRSFGAFGANPTTLDPAFPGFQFFRANTNRPVSFPQCSAFTLGCDVEGYGFGGVTSFTPNATPPGTYTIGSVNLDTAGTLPGTIEILHFLLSPEAVLDGNENPASVQLGSATLNIIPEPGTAGLLGAGVVCLALAARRTGRPSD